MSCVVGLIQNGMVYIGSDGLATTEEGERRPVICIKIFTNKEYLIGFAGSVRHGQLLGPKFLDAPASVYDFPDAIREVFIEKGAIMTTDTGQQMHNSNILIGHKGRLFELLIFKLMKLWEILQLLVLDQHMLWDHYLQPKSGRLQKIE